MKDCGVKLAIMQPYFLPYIGYFQLIAAVDKFVIFDDVCYINRGWINRNKIIVNNDAWMFTIPLCKSSQNKLISDMYISENPRWREKLLLTVKYAYKGSRNFERVYELLVDIINFPSMRLNEFLLNSIYKVSEYLDIKTHIVPSSCVYSNVGLKGQSRILDICRKEHAVSYINPIGGRLLYQRSSFDSQGIDLLFLQSMMFSYVQDKVPEEPRLSILDTLMNHSQDFIKRSLTNFELLND